MQWEVEKLAVWLGSLREVGDRQRLVGAGVELRDDRLWARVEVGQPEGEVSLISQQVLERDHPYR